MPARIDAEPLLLGVLDDRRKVLLQLFGRQSAQPVVAAERHDQGLRLALRHRVLESPQSARRGVARHARVRRRGSARPPCPGAAESRDGKTLFERQAETGGQAVAEDDDAGGVLEILAARRPRPRGRRGFRGAAPSPAGLPAARSRSGSRNAAADQKRKNEEDTRQELPAAPLPSLYVSGAKASFL